MLNETSLSLHSCPFQCSIERGTLFWLEEENLELLFKFWLVSLCHWCFQKIMSNWKWEMLLVSCWVSWRSLWRTHNFSTRRQKSDKKAVGYIFCCFWNCKNSKQQECASMKYCICSQNLYTLRCTGFSEIEHM